MRPELNKKSYYSLLLLVLSFILSCKKEEVSDTEKENKPPVVEMLSPIGNVLINIGDTVKIIGLASDEDGEISQVLFYIDGTLEYTDNAEPYEYSRRFDKAGRFQVIVKAFDNKGVSATGYGPTIEVRDLYNPVVYLSYSPSWNVAEFSIINFSVNASSSNGEITEVSLYIDDDLYAVDNTFPYTFAWDSVPAGEYSVFSVAKDEKGRLGESNTQTIKVSSNKSPFIEFSSPGSYPPDYLPGGEIYIDFYAYDSDGSITKIEVFANDELIQTLINTDYFYWKNIPSGNYTLTAKAYDNKGAIGNCGPVNIKVLPGIITGGIISDLVSSERSDLVFGINQTTNKLLFINPETATMTETTLPSSQPIAMDYSLTDKKLYILYKFSGYISVWDNQSQSLSILQFSGISDGRDIEVDAVNRRIYVLSNTGLFIIDMDNGTVLLNDAPMQGNSMGIDPANRFLFSASEGGSQIFKYSVASDLVSLLQTKNSAGSNARRIAINTAKGYVVLPCGGGNGAGYTLFSFDESNLNNVMGEFNIGTYPAYASFTADGETLLGTCGDPYDTYIYVMDADSYVQQKKIFFPNADDYSRLCANDSNTKIVAFSYDSYYDEEYVLYIFDL